MSRDIVIAPLTQTAFAPFGDVLEATGAPDKLINQGLCGRFDDRAHVDFTNGRPGLSLFRSECRSLPYALEMVERHPQGSQAFMSMSDDPFLVIVAPDAGGTPGRPLAFVTNGRQAVNYHRDVWHGVLTPLSGPGLFAVLDRIGAGPNLQEHWFDAAYTVVRPEGGVR